MNSFNPFFYFCIITFILFALTVFISNFILECEKYRVNLKIQRCLGCINGGFIGVFCGIIFRFYGPLDKILKTYSIEKMA